MTWHGTGPSGYFFTPNFDAITGRVDWEPPKGDVSGVVDALIVVGLQGFPISPTVPTSGNVLQWDGFQWIPGAPVVVSGVSSPHNLLSSTHTDTITDSPVDGDLVAGSGAPASWTRLPIGDCGQFLGVGNDGSLEWKITTSKVDIITSGTFVNLDQCSHKVILNGLSGVPPIVNLPNSPRFGQEILIKDGAGTSNTNNVHIIPQSGAFIDGRSELILSNDYQTWCLTWTGSAWSII